MAEVTATPDTPARLAERLAEFLARLADLLRQARVLLPLQLAALWPVWRWYAARMQDGSDEPLGPLALVLALALLWGRRGEFRAAPRALPLVAAAGLTLAATGADLPPLLRALLGMAALGATLAAFLPRPREAAPLAALLALSLPLVASLQFYAGYPLRLLAAEGASLLLRGLGFEVLAEGAALRAGERLMLVDAPCSGVHMLWVGLVAAAGASAAVRAGPARLLRNGGLAVALVLLGNVVRNGLLFFKETGLWPLPAWTHEGIGLLLFVLVLAPLARVSLRPESIRPPPEAKPDEPKLAILAAAAFLLAALAGFQTAAPAPPIAGAEPEWPRQIAGQDLVRLPLSAAETRWLRGFPGAAARFTDGRRDWLLRQLERPTRLLHPAADCYRGLGYRVGKAEVRAIAGERWSCFNARREGSGKEVCERIEDTAGGAWTDVSAWYWDAVLGRSRGPWRSVTRAGPQAEE